jgi:hypothetical protein
MSSETQQHRAGLAVWAVASGVVLAAALPVAPAHADPPLPVCTSECTDIDWCETVDRPKLLELRTELSANIVRAENILLSVPLDHPQRLQPQHHLDWQLNARDRLDLALATWDLTVVSFADAGGLMGNAGGIAETLEQASWHATVTAIYFEDERARDSLEHLRALKARFNDLGTRSARCYMRHYLPPC